MKKVISLVLFIIICSTINGQDHLKFKGFEINGKVNNFGKLLEKDGYKFLGGEDGFYFYSGEFESYKKSTISIAGTKISSIIWQVLVLLPEFSTWRKTKESYFALKDQFNIKYGLGKSVEYFKYPYKDGDGSESYAFASENAAFITFWELTNGFVTLEIATANQVMITYEDALNVKIKVRERATKMINEL